VVVHILILDSSLYARVSGLQSTDSDPQAHLGRGNETAGGANISFPHPAVLRFYFDNYLSRSLAAQGLEIFSVEKHIARSGPLGGVARSLGTTTILLQ
jgi:hypothetical protein